MVKGETGSGIQFSIDERIKDDARLLYLMTKLQSKEVKEDQAAASDCVFKVFKLIFGTDEKLIEFMNAVAAANDGVCSVERLIEELLDMFEALNVKNSLSSPE